MPEPAHLSRIGIGDGPEIPCRIVSGGFVPDRLADRARRQYGPVPDLVVEFEVNLDAFTAAMARAREGLDDLTLQAYEGTRVTHALIEAMNRRADERIAAWRARRESTPEDTIDWGDPIEDSDADWPARGAVNEVCAHVCGGGPGHACEARAETFLQYALPSGGTRDMPICRPCYDAETADVAHAQA